MNQPNSHKGTLVLLSTTASNANALGSNKYFVFQYNPEKLVHTFNQNTTVQNELHGEFFSLKFDLDSVDFDEATQTQITSQFGIHPALALLEAMTQQQKTGNQTLEPIIVFNWGTKRSVPVHVVNMNIEEQSFDTALNPTRATVNLTLKVLETTEVSGNPEAKKLCQAHQTTRALLVDVYKLQTGQGRSTVGASQGVPGTAVTSVGSLASVSNLKSTVSKVETVKTIRSIKRR